MYLLKMIAQDIGFPMLLIFVFIAVALWLCKALKANVTTNLVQQDRPAHNGTGLIRAITAIIMAHFPRARAE